MFNKDGYIIPEKKVIPVKEWQSLSDERIKEIWTSWMLMGNDPVKFARAIEQALKELNAKK